MSTSLQSVANIDIDLITLPSTDLPEDIDESDHCETQPQTHSSNSNRPTIEKWDWNADFIPLHWDGSVTVLPPTERSNDTPTLCEASKDPNPSKSPLKHTTQSYRDDSKTTIPPWISSSYPNHHFIDRLHMELVDFCMYVSPTQQEHSMRLKLIDTIKQIVLNLWSNATIHVFGSMKTKLYLPTSDIDLAVYPNRNTNHSNGDCKLQLAQALKQANMCSYLEIISTARVPLVKFTDAESGISVDIIFDRPSGIIAADEINSLQTKYPVLRPLTYFLKYFLWFRDLNEPFRGGMGSYLLQMLIVNLIQTHPIRATRRWRYVDEEISLGGWLLAFFELYGKNFNYSDLGISPYPNAHYFLKEDHGMKIYDRPHLLCCQCPFESTSSKIMDSGRNTYNIMKIKMAFEWAHNTLLAHNRDGSNTRKSILGLLVGIRGQMLHIRSKENKLLKFQAPTAQQLEMNQLLSKTFEMESMDHWSSDAESERSDTQLFIPLNDESSTCTTSSLSSTLSSSSGSSSSYAEYDDALPYYEASEFQQNHLFNANLSKLSSKTMRVLNNRKPSNKGKAHRNDMTFSFEKKIDTEDNPYLNQKYNPFKKNAKKRSYSAMQEDGFVTPTRPAIKKRKTIGTTVGSESSSYHMDTAGDNLTRSYSMPDLKKATPCIFYKKGRCNKGELCPFQHGEEDITMQDTKLLIDSSLEEASLFGQVCWNFSAGHCFRGKKCRWLHPK